MEKGGGQRAPPEGAQSPAALEPVEDVPDPEEDDLDDLDDMLDDFQATKIDKPKDTPPVAQEPESVKASSVQEPDIADAAADEFSKQLQEQMAALMGNVDETPEMKKEIEAMMRELGAAADTGASADASAGTSKDAAGSGKAQTENAADEPFQETIRKTMERIQASGEQATTAAQQPAEPNDDLLAQMLRDMQSGGLEGTGDEEGFNKMLMGMMEQLTNKEVLYEPMKELHDKFPAWMEKNRTSTGEEDLKRYEEQQRLVGEIVRRFDSKGYSDSKAEDREYIVERMQQMQTAGSPPADLVGDMNAAQEALGDLDSGCAQQ